MFQVVVNEDSKPDRAIQLTGKVTIGREAGCQVWLDNHRVSRAHAILEETPDGLMLIDLGSTNGTRLNGIPLISNTPTPVPQDSTVSIQGFQITVTLPEEEREATVQMVVAPPGELHLRTHLVTDSELLEVWDGSERELAVAGVLDETEDVKTFRLVGLSPLLFSYKPGQSMGVTVAIDGRKVRRSYSISSSPARPHVLELTIKRVPGGLVSNWLSDNVAVGGRMTLRGPLGKFSCFNHPSSKLMLVAAGVGITPLMSMLRWIVDSGAPADVILFYSVRRPQDLVYGRELESIVALHANIRVVVTVTGGSGGSHGWMGLCQRLSGNLIASSAPDFREREVFLCGPTIFADAIKEDLVQAGLPATQFHMEKFGGAKKPKSASRATVEAPPMTAATAPPAAPVSVPAVQSAVVPPPAPAVPPAQAAPPIPAVAEVPPPVPSPAPIAEGGSGFQVHFLKSAVQCVSEPDATLLDLAEENDMELAYSCREGSCGTCLVRCVQGSVEMTDNELSADELEAGWIYACVAKPTSDVQIDA